MEAADLKIKAFLEKERARLGGARRPGAYPDTGDIVRFLNDELKGAELETMLDHLKESPEDRRLVEEARLLLDPQNRAEGVEMPQAVVEMAKKLVKPAKTAECPHCGKPITPFRGPLGTQHFRNVALAIGAVLSFALSFAYPRYYMQFLLVTLLFGVKFIVDRKALKTQILIYKALENEHKSHLHNTPSRL